MVGTTVACRKRVAKAMINRPYILVVQQVRIIVWMCSWICTARCRCSIGIAAVVDNTSSTDSYLVEHDMCANDVSALSNCYLISNGPVFATRLLSALDSFSLRP